MGYVVGVDLGTTFTAAAVWRDGSAQVSSLGSRGPVIPSVVLLREDQTELTGEAADRRAMTEPERVAREFKRRLGDTTPILVGGSPYSPEALMGRLLRAVIDEVATHEGGPADAIAVCHPANWGPYKIELLGQGIRIADLPDVPTLLSEPEAAAIWYATQQRLDPGEVVAVYDLGGGTFDAAVLRRTHEGFEILGQPEGIERLGGIDFDAAVFAHVRRSLGNQLDELDEGDPAAQNAVARLRADSIEAKEALSSDSDAAVPVMLPNIQTEILITRTEFETMIRPALVDSIDALRRALRSANVEPDSLKAVLLVGGSSRIPLVGRLVSAEIGRPVALDTHPKHAIALGAAHAAALASGAQTLLSPAQSTEPAPAPPPVTPPVTPPAAAEPTPVTPPAAAEPAPVTPPAAAEPAPVTPPAAAEPTPVTPPATAPPASDAPPVSTEPTQTMPAVAVATEAVPASRRAQLGEAKGIVVIAGVAAIVVLVAVVAWALTRGDGSDTATGQGAQPEEPADDTESATTTMTTTSTTQAPSTTEPPSTTEAPACRDVTTELCIEITDVQISADGLGLVIDWDPFNFTPLITDNHAHFYWNTSDPTTVGTQAPAEERNSWDPIDARPYDSTDRDDRTMRLAQRPPGATEVCATPANGDHAVIDPTIFDCFDFPTR